ncbi:MAG: hypothetical protein K0R29_250 [Pseudobdellovibrio sp.]|jgi:hypothetical protein|nr:hypothetical protein [Pseudobdellovibrio sp.]
MKSKSWEKMSKIFVGLLLLLASVCSYGFPEIISWQNSPLVVFDNKAQAVLSKKGLLKRPFALVTASRDELQLSVNHFDRLTVYEKSKLQVLDFANDGEIIADLYLLNGKIRYTKNFRGKDKVSGFDITVKSAFFDLKVSKPVDFFIELNMNEAWVEIKVIKGSLPLEFFAYEKKVTLVEGQKARFQGERSADKTGIQYDFLLGGRKVPKGQLSEVSDFDTAAYLKADEAVRLKEIQRKKESEAKRLEKIRKQKEYEDSFLCKNPFAHKDQCAWYLEDKKCFRKRCNASGSWGDIIERPVTANCKPQPVVAPCDY